MSPAAKNRASDRTRAAIEVLVVFALMHTTFRLLYRYSALGDLDRKFGTLFTPGLVMLGFAYGLCSLRGTLRQSGLIGGSLGTSFVAFGLATLCRLVGQVVLRALTSSPDVVTMIAVDLGVTLLVVLALSRPTLGDLRVSNRRARTILLWMAAVPSLIAILSDRPAIHALSTTAWVLIGTGLGEEAFFRGYAQSRLNQSFGRPWSIGSVRFGPGLLLASLLFGVIHGLNSFDTLRWSGAFSLTATLAQAATLYFGLLRERTGTIWASAMLHGFCNLAVRV